MWRRAERGSGSAAVLTRAVSASIPGGRSRPGCRRAPPACRLPSRPAVPRSVAADRGWRPAPGRPSSDSARRRGCSGPTGARRGIRSGSGLRPGGPSAAAHRVAHLRRVGAVDSVVRACAGRGSLGEEVERTIRSVGVISDQPLCSSTKTTGSLRDTAKTIASWTAPWLLAPSPIDTTVTPPSARCCCAMATPAAMGAARPNHRARR